MMTKTVAFVNISIHPVTKEERYGDALYMYREDAEEAGAEDPAYLRTEEVTVYRDEDLEEVY